MRIPLSLLAVAVFAAPLQADTSGDEPIRFKGRHQIAVNVGMLTDVASSASVVSPGVSIEADGFGGMAALRYSYWFAEYLALDFTVGVMDADATVVVDRNSSVAQAGTVTRFLVGVKYQPLSMAMGRNIRPYASASLGPYSGSASGERTGLASVEFGSYSESTIGARLGIGMDIITKGWFAVGLEAGYGFVGDFDRRIGSELNYSSPEFLISLGASLGGIR